MRGMAYRIWHEGRGRFPIVNVEPVLADDERTHGHGPFSGSRELIETVVATEVGRCLAAGCPSPAGRMVDTWRLRFQAPAGDLERLRAALTAFLQDADDAPLRRYLQSPPRLVRAAASVG
jgi:hypothetical protein